MVGGCAKEFGLPSKISKACPCHWLFDGVEGLLHPALEVSIEGRDGYSPGVESPLPVSHT